MKSLIEVEPSTLIWIVFAIAIFILPIVLIFLGIQLDARYVGFFVGLGLVIFFFGVYPTFLKIKIFYTNENKIREC